MLKGSLAATICACLQQFRGYDHESWYGLKIFTQALHKIINFKLHDFVLAPPTLQNYLHPPLMDIK